MFFLENIDESMPGYCLFIYSFLFYYFFYFIFFQEARQIPIKFKALNFRNAPCNTRKQNYLSPVLEVGGKTGTRGTPTEANLDWKPNALKRRDGESNPGLIGAKQGKIHYVSLLPLSIKILHIHSLE